MTAASMESCRFAAARRSPRGRFWSVVDVRKNPTAAGLGVRLRGVPTTADERAPAAELSVALRRRAARREEPLRDVGLAPEAFLPTDVP